MAGTFSATVVVGILGLRLDAGQTEERWTRWRPTVSLCQHEDLVVDRLELGAIVDVCQKSRSLSAAGRELFAVSRQAKANPNDADRLRKYLARFGLTWHDVASP